ncbi:MAG: low molecular weight protein-tyrosine-phosphatase [Luteimonas sp.]
MLQCEKTRTASGFADRARVSCAPRAGCAAGEQRHTWVFRKILIVCIGNICRSPTAEIVLRHALDRPDIEVSSAGLQALVDRPVDPTAAELLRGRGLDPDAHRARQVTPDLLGSVDLVLVMERAQQARIVRDAPQASGKTLLLGKWRGDLEIPDPYRQQRPAFEHVLRLIDESVAGWRPYLR